MQPEDIATRYDAIAKAWDADVIESSYGLPYVHRAIAAAAGHGLALDVGCGSGGRITFALLRAGFEVLGIDVSAAMLEIARRRHPSVQFIQADICRWEPPGKCALIIAWDSIFHVPYAQQEAVTRRLCRSLAPGGVLLFTADA